MAFLFLALENIHLAALRRQLRRLPTASCQLPVCCCQLPARSSVGRLTSMPCVLPVPAHMGPSRRHAAQPPPAPLCGSLSTRPGFPIFSKPTPAMQQVRLVLLLLVGFEEDQLLHAPPGFPVFFWYSVPAGNCQSMSINQSTACYNGAF